MLVPFYDAGVDTGGGDFHCHRRLAGILSIDLDRPAEFCELPPRGPKQVPDAETDLRTRRIDLEGFGSERWATHHRQDRGETKLLHDRSVGFASAATRL